MLSVQDIARPGLGPICFELQDGECIAVRGPSGAGKSLLLRAIADLDPNSGKVMLDGQAREAMPAPQWRRLVAYLPAEPGWWADRVGAHYSNWAEAVPLVEALGLPADCDHWPVLRLSTGERQRLGLVRMLQLAPRVLLLDEPTSGLDDESSDRVEHLVQERLAQGAGALWVTHDQAQARRLAKRVLVISEGQAREVSP